MSQVDSTLIVEGKELIDLSWTRIESKNFFKSKGFETYSAEFYKI